MTTGTKVTTFTIGEVIYACLLFGFCSFIPTAIFFDYLGYTKCEMEHRIPAYPLRQIENVPPGHNDVYIDRRYYYWVDPPRGGDSNSYSLESCSKCHGDRWNYLGSLSLTRELAYWRGGTKYIQNDSKREYK